MSDKEFKALARELAGKQRHSSSILLLVIIALLSVVFVWAAVTEIDSVVRGSGKTVSAINIYNVLFNYTPKWNVFLLIKASLKNDPWLKDLNGWLEKNNMEGRHC